MNTNQQTVHQMGFGINEMVKQATGRESVSSIDMDWVSVEQLARYIYGAGSGDVVSFNTNIPDAIESLIAYIEAVQDLNGYENPWPGGAGKNKIDKSLFTDGYHIDATTYLPAAFPGRICTLNPIMVSGTSMVISFRNLVSSESDIGVIYSVFDGDTKKRRGSEKNQDVVIDISDGDRVYISMYKTVAGSNTSQNISLDDFDNLQLEYGSTKTSFAPYANICPITGWTGCNVSRTGKNLLDRDKSTKNYYINASGVPTSNNDFEYSELIPVNEPKFYIEFTTTEATSRYYRLHGYNSEGTWVEQIDAHQITAAGSYKYNVSVPSAIKYVRYSYPKAATDISVEGLNIYSFTWQTEAGTVYGGTLDVLTGVLTVSLASWTLDGSEEGWSLTTASSGRRFRIEVSNLTGMAGSGNANTVISDKFVWSDSANATWGHIRLTGDYLNFTDNGSVIADKTAFLAWLSDNNTQVVAPLSTPLTYQLTAQEVTALIGQNNIFADTGNVSVQYKVKEDLV